MTSLRARAGAFGRRVRDGVFGAQRHDEAVKALDDLTRGQRALAEELTAVRADLQQIRNDVWASKVASVGDRLLVGSRHEKLVFLVEAEDELIVPRFVVEGEYEPDTTAFVRQTVRDDSICVDVGANFGYFTCLMGHLAWNGKVIAYEADPKIYELLLSNVSMNWCERNVDPVNAAVAAEVGELTLHRWLHRSGNTGVIAPPPDWVVESEAFTVPSITLDSLVGQFPRVDLVKIDVEGGESMVVAGMSEFVASYRPTVILEWSPDQIVGGGSTPVELAASVGAWDMDISALGPGGRCSPINFATLVSLPYQNVVLTPRERRGA